MNINQNYIEAVKTIKEAILRSQYRAAASEQGTAISLLRHRTGYVSEKFPYRLFGERCN